MNHKIVLTTAVLLCLSGAALAAEIVEKPARVVSTLVETAAIVESVDRETREIRLIDAQGNRFTVVADDSVRNFDEIEARDRIVTEYLESVAIVILPHGAAAPGQGAAVEVEVAELGDKPGMGVATVEIISAEIHGLNRADRLVTLEMQGGEMRTIKAADNAPLDKVSVGDLVRMRITKAVAVKVVEPDM